MLKLLLDEHIYSGLAEILRAAAPELEVASLHAWRRGRLLNQSDSRILREAHEAGMTLVTFDVATIPPLLAEMAEMAEPHAGVIFVSTRTFAQNDYGALAQALLELWKNTKSEEWANRIVFLKRK